uniref:Putative ankyrin repeat protein n=1 Tax=Moumouvirus sp. 'Monve' TaxID=1128131 RepID=H2EFC6_9VIRU|nr:putative ankyrin repeat protein [Moumouvirus Monve]
MQYPNDFEYFEDVEKMSIGILSDKKLRNIRPAIKIIIDSFQINRIDNDLNYDEKFYLLLKCIRNKSLNYFMQFAIIFNEIDLSDEENLLLNTACGHEMYDVVKYLIENGASVTYNNNKAIKIAACYNNNTNIIRYLIDSGADPHIDEEYPLCIATQTGNVEIFTLLLKYNCNINARNNYCLKTSVFNYFSRGLIDLLLEHGANVHCNNEYVLRYAVYMCDIYLVNKFLQYGANINSITNDCLLQVIKNGDIRLIKLLINHNVDFSRVNNEKIKANKTTEKINLLINQGVDHSVLLNLLVKDKDINDEFNSD